MKSYPPAGTEWMIPRAPTHTDGIIWQRAKAVMALCLYKADDDTRNRRMTCSGL